jgi:hypothetical protein
MTVALKKRPVERLGEEVGRVELGYDISDKDGEVLCFAANVCLSNSEVLGARVIDAFCAL